MSKFTVFWRLYCKEQYRLLWMSLRIGMGGMFCRYRPEGNNPMTMFDHGLIWRLLRDAAVVVMTILRVLVGLFVFVSVVILGPVLAILRALVIPFAGVVKGLWLHIKVARARRAFSGE